MGKRKKIVNPALAPPSAQPDASQESRTHGTNIRKIPRQAPEKDTRPKKLPEKDTRPAADQTLPSARNMIRCKYHAQGCMREWRKGCIDNFNLWQHEVACKWMPPEDRKRKQDEGAGRVKKRKAFIPSNDMSQKKISQYSGFWTFKAADDDQVK